jgi:uncharacterized protein with PQ loop repeat
MDWVTIFGVSASVFTSFRFIPQVHQSLTTRKTRDLSILFLIFVTLQSLLLILYGMVKPDYFVLFMNILPIICTSLLMYLKLRYH